MAEIHFSEQALAALRRARQHAVESKATTVDPDHVALGLLTADGESVALILADLQVDVLRLRADVEQRLVRRKRFWPRRGLPYSRRAKRVLEHAISLSRALGFDYVGSEHIFLAILLEHHSTVTQLLDGRGVTEYDFRRRIGQLQQPAWGTVPSHAGPESNIVKVIIGLESRFGDVHGRTFADVSAALSYLRSVEIQTNNLTPTNRSGLEETG